MSKHNRDRRAARMLAKLAAGILPFAPGKPGARRAAIQERYPVPPRYDGRPQPACYEPEHPAPTKRPKLAGTARALQGLMRFPQAYRGRG